MQTLCTLGHATKHVQVQGSRGTAGSEGKMLDRRKAALVTETAELKFTAESRLLTGSLHVSDGIMKVPLEFKEVLRHLTTALNPERSEGPYFKRARCAGPRARSASHGGRGR